MAVMQMTPNMGVTDRIVRGILGGLMLFNGATHMRKSPARVVEAGVGGAFLLYGITGFDPLLKMFGASTISGAKDNILHRMKQAAPGQGINPMLTQQAIPQKTTRGINPKETAASSTAIS